MIIELFHQIQFLNPVSKDEFSLTMYDFWNGLTGFKIRNKRKTGGYQTLLYKVVKIFRRQFKDLETGREKVNWESFELLGMDEES